MPDQEPPPEEIEMGLDEFREATGQRPIARTPEEGIKVMTARLEYLTGQFNQLAAAGAAATAAANELARQITQAKHQLAAYQLQREGRN